MIRKIQCMVAKFNGEAELQAKYCGPYPSLASPSTAALPNNKTAVLLHPPWRCLIIVLGCWSIRNYTGYDYTSI